MKKESTTLGQYFKSLGSQVMRSDTSSESNIVSDEKPSLKNRLAKHLVAGAAAVAIAGSANAAIVTWNSNLVIPNNIDGQYINVETQLFGSAAGLVAGWDLNPYGTSTTTMSWFAAAAPSGCVTGLGTGGTIVGVANLSNGTVVGSTSTYGNTASGVANGGWVLNANNYFGFRFTAADGLTHYGYGKMLIGATMGVRTLVAVYYESTAATAITVVAASVCTAPTLSATTVAALCAGNANGSINLTTTGGSPTPFTYAWSNGGSTEDLSGLAAGSYTVTVTTTGGCSVTGSYTVAAGAANVTYYADADGDTYGNAAVSQTSCTGAPVGYVSNSTDCNDANAAVNSAATEICNSIDDDCDTQIDEGLTFTNYYADVDGDGYGAGTATNACAQPVGYVSNSTDCNDANAAVNPAATEVCNGIDDDCNGSIEVQPAMPSSQPSTNYNSLLAFTTAAVTAGYTISSTETFDAYNGFYANGIGSNFGVGTPTWTADAPGNLYAGSGFMSTNNAEATLTLTFNPGVTAVGLNTFVTDASFNVIPGTITVTYLNGSTTSFSTTSASDFFGVTSNSTLITTISIGGSAAAAGTGFVTIDNLVIATGTITTPAVALACYQSYVYNSNTCSWEVTGTQPSQPSTACYQTATFNTTSCVWDVTATGGSTTYYADVDVDGFGDASASIQGYTCLGTPAGYVTDATDCNDNNAAVNSAATEICNSIDDDCDTQIDEGLTFTNYYADVDGDSFGAGTAVNACAQPVGYVLTNTDCNDNNAAVNPTATESCSTAFDDNCNGQINEGCSVVAGDNPSNATSMSTSIWPNCSASNGTLVGAGASASAQTICLTGEDKWHQFVATSEGVSIVVNSSAADILIELQTAAGALVAEENAVSGLGGETLNHYGLTAGQVYKIGVRNYNSALGTGTYTICAKMLKRGGCDYGPGPYTLCQYFKATWAGATGSSYTFTYTGLTGPAAGNVYTRTQNSDICVLSTVLPTLPYGSTYNVLISNTYTLNNGAGVAEAITVPGLAPCSMSTVAQPVTALRTSDRCTAGPRFRGAVVAALPWVCGSTNWRWEFTELNAQSQPVGLPIAVNRGAASNYINLGTVLQLQYGKTYSVRTAPILSYTGTDYQWGTPFCMSIVGSAGMIADGSQVANQAVRMETANEVNMSLYPNPTHGTDVNINLSGVTSENVQIRIVDAMGRQVWSNRYSVDGILNTNITFEQPLANGLYFVEAIYNGELQTQRMMVQK